MINKDQNLFQYNSGDLLYIISLLTSQLRTSSRKEVIKISRSCSNVQNIDPHKYLLMILDSKKLRGLFEQERLKPAIIRTCQGYIHNLPKLKQVINIDKAVINKISLIMYY